MLVNVGDTYGRWTVIGFGGTKVFPSNSNKIYNLWLCRCSCGTERPVLQMSLRNGTSSSCGCYTIERSKEVNTIHGASINGKTPEYYVWQAMLARCTNSNDPRFADYGGRGITVDPDWRDFRNFIRDMGERPSPKHSLDRKKNDLNYTKDNCKWSLPHEQMVNRRNSFYVDDIPLSDLARQHNIPANTLRARLLKGWPVEEALSRPVRPKRPNHT